MKNLALSFLIALSGVSGVYAYGNIDYYPNYDSMPYTYYDYQIMKQYVEDGQKYVDRCNEDIAKIIAARDKAIRDVNDAIDLYKTLNS